MSFAVIYISFGHLADISQSRLDFAKKMGADHILLVDTKDVREMAGRGKDSLGGRMPEITIECSGAESAIQMAIYVGVTLNITLSNLSVYIIV